MAVTLALSTVKEMRSSYCRRTYLFGWDLDTDLLDSLGELIRLNGSIVVEVEVLEGLLEDRLLGLSALGLFR